MEKIGDNWLVVLTIALTIDNGISNIGISANKTSLVKVHFFYFKTSL